MRDVLVLGGTRFLGRHVVAAASARGFRVTTFTRGRVYPPEFADVERLIGDRDAEVSALRGRAWHLVIDTSAYHPRHVDRVAAVIGDVNRYVLISTASVYREFPDCGATESAATHAPLIAPEATVSPDTYGALKRACEETALRHYQERAVLVRPGLLVGPFDPTGRFRYWVSRAVDGGEILAPGRPDRVVQILDARDLAHWIMDLPERCADQVFNVAGPAETITMGDLLTTCTAMLAPSARLTWVSDEFLLNRGVVPWTELPLWIPWTAGPLLRLDDRKAREMGLRHRSVQDTIVDVLNDRAAHDDALVGALRKAQPLSNAREAALLAEWRTSAG